MSEFHERASEHMNVSPTKLVRLIKKEKDLKKRQAMKRALYAWRITHGNPLTRSAKRVARAWLASFLSL